MRFWRFSLLTGGESNQFAPPGISRGPGVRGVAILVPQNAQTDVKVCE